MSLEERTLISLDEIATRERLALLIPARNQPAKGVVSFDSGRESCALWSLHSTIKREVDVENLPDEQLQARLSDAHKAMLFLQLYLIKNEMQLSSEDHYRVLQSMMALLALMGKPIVLPESFRGKEIDHDVQVIIDVWEIREAARAQVENYIDVLIKEASPREIRRP